MILTAKRYSAAEASSRGLVDDTASNWSGLVTQAITMASEASRRIATATPESIRHYKQLLYLCADDKSATNQITARL
jgi:enoyl-CoA hydratase/carnithine racemase